MMVIVMRMKTIMTDIMRMRKSIILPVGTSKYKVDHGDGSNLIHVVSCNVTNPQGSKDLPNPSFNAYSTVFFLNIPANFCSSMVHVITEDSS